MLIINLIRRTTLCCAQWKISADCQVLLHLTGLDYILPSVDSTTAFLTLSHREVTEHNGQGAKSLELYFPGGLNPAAATTY